MDETRSGSGQAESCLKALHSLVAYGHDSLTSLFTSELLELLVSRCANLGVVGPTVRTVLGILGNLASRSEEFCKELEILLGFGEPNLLRKVWLSRWCGTRIKCHKSLRWRLKFTLTTPWPAW
eukprot:symbB.v1.2.010827.t1/scaffold711.1/size292957/8